MDGVLLQSPMTNDFDQMLDPVESLRAEVKLLRADVDRLQRENLESRQQAGYWKSCFHRQQKRVAALQSENEQLRGEIRGLKAERFGRKSEKQSKKDRSNHLDASQDDIKDKPHTNGKRGQQPGRPGPKRRDHSHLSAIEEPIALPENECACPNCGMPRVPMTATEDSEVIEIDVKPHRRVIRRQRARATCHCGSRTITAPAPPKLIPKGCLGVSIWREILLAKFDSHQPISRLLSQWSLLGLDVPLGTVLTGLKRLQPLFEPVYEAFCTRNAESAYAQADETRWQVFIDYEGKVGHRWWLWVFLGEDTVVYRLDPHRSHDVPEDHFGKDAACKLMVDRYSAYKAMLQVKSGSIVLVFCWAHVRRDFIAVGKSWEELKEWALSWLRRIRDLYRLNRQRLAAASDAEAFAQADALLRHEIAAMKQQATDELVNPKLREPCRKVLTSLMEHWSGLTLFVDDPHIPMDNNASERRVRGPAVGRKNYYGSGSQWSGQLAVMLFSLFATLKMHGLNIRSWLQWYLQSCAETGGKAPEKIEPFLPWNLSPEDRQRLTSPIPTDSS